MTVICAMSASTVNLLTLSMRDRDMEWDMEKLMGRGNPIKKDSILVVKGTLQQRWAPSPSVADVHTQVLMTCIPCGQIFHR